ncbi:ABC transporter ATP-binding protein [Bifidobacterium sp. UTCIF-37]|uniref:dipeptide ABC transporter ATP-binding protein n=1 Tax=unclassified Bifidobacterium TaxID=2608897 RepID=UPI001128F05B|nr:MULTISPECIES: ABC transporter ATP-binding protein [unclassified Bifidobacterium]TPF85831.1 ABC transporter ATP-binding protein [Bifidobacterium sp. UTCIF-37]TPF87846.1 ABC transporter ATP-binding protein [Bifidobacterium sp. UTCIF-38]
MSEPRAIVTVDGLSVSFDEREVTHGVSLKLYPGRITALVGESGSGKSVTAMALPRLDPSVASVKGHAFLDEGGDGDDHDIDLLADDAPLQRIRGEYIGTVFQEPSTAFNPVFTLGMQVAESLKYHQRNLSAAERKAKVLEQLREVGLQDAERVWSSYPHELSGGQLQRVMIAMAIINRPKVLIADEPTTALDVTTQQAILKLISSLAAELDLAVLLITHDMGVVWQAAQDVYVMHDGVIVEQGSVGEVFRNPKDDYTRMLLAAVPRLHVEESAEPAIATVREPEPGQPEKSDDAGERAALGDGRVAASIEGVSVAYRPGKYAVEDISFDLVAGRTRALVGESGAGKTTIAKVISGQLSPTRGRVLIDGEDLARAHGRRKRGILSHMGYVFQDSGSALNPRKSVAWSISEPMSVQGGFSQADRRKRVLELLDQVELPADVADRFPHQLSGGQRQRVGIARALALSPSLLIADEPTSSLDVTVQRRVLDLLHRLQVEEGFACLFITHDLGIVQEVSDVITVLRNGHVVESGATDEVLNYPRAQYTRTLLDASPKIDL